MKNRQAPGRLTGTRLRERRLGLAIKQSELARAVGISPAYLNLIEHNKRRIGGKLLVDLARALGAEPGELSEGAEVQLLGLLSAAAARQPEVRAELERAEELVGRFPGWAAVIAAQHAGMRELERLVEALSDRLTHDPHLAASLHEVLSSVTAIRSAVSILTGDGEVDPEWQARFLRNVAEDSARLSESVQGLAGFLEADSTGETGHMSPHEELSGFLGAAGYFFAELEPGGGGEPEVLAANAPGLQSGAARRLAADWLRRYAADAAAQPRAGFAALWRESGHDPLRCAARLGVSPAAVLRRAACLGGSGNGGDGGGDSGGGGGGDGGGGEAALPGLVICDGSGTLTTRKDVPGFTVPRYGAACPRWPLFQALSQPARPIRALVEMPGEHGHLFTCLAISEPAYPDGVDGLAVHEATMLIMAPEAGGGGGGADAPLTVGPGCRVCPRAGCPARREPSLLAPEA